MSDKEIFEDTDLQKDQQEVEAQEEQEEDGYEDVCYICRRPESKAGKIRSAEDEYDA